jgi:hypothetical protein
MQVPGYISFLVALQNKEEGNNFLPPGIGLY